jgi:hypothetical protein
MTFADQIILTNAILGYIKFFPLILNLKYYIQIKIKDYLYISLFFIFSILTEFSTSWDIWDNLETYRVFIFFGGISYYFGTLVAIRTKYEDPPNSAKLIPYLSIIVFSILYLLIPKIIVNGWWIGQYFFNPLQILLNSYIVYCFISTPAFITQSSKAKMARNLWILYFLGRVVQNIVAYYFVLSGNWTDYILVNALLSGVVLLILHIFYPESVLISFEQLHRAKHIYKKVQIKGNIIAKIGISNIQNYINSIPDELKKDLPIDN